MFTQRKREMEKNLFAEHRCSPRATQAEPESSAVRDQRVKGQDGLIAGLIVSAVFQF